MGLGRGLAANAGGVDRHVADYKLYKSLILDVIFKVKKKHGGYVLLILFRLFFFSRREKNVDFFMGKKCRCGSI